ncbi:Phytochelatin synthase-domain-containing protein [Pilobolus umbonatus]|nr:Phytochelatin synthase-domain-containing protein [Pilobolus umbonatus]
MTHCSRSIGTQTDTFGGHINTQSTLDSAKSAIDSTRDTQTSAKAVAVFQDLLGVNTPPKEDDLKNTFYQRELPSTLTRFSSPEGKKLFREAMDAAQAEGFFPLTGNFTTQSEPAYCGPSSLAMVLNALEVDPKRRWKGNWRWFSDEFLQCCSSKEDMKKNGITFDNFACLAKCHCDVQVKRAHDFEFEEFKKDVQEVTSTSDKFMVISFSRKTLKQTGDGHFSPIGAYHPESEMVLILDTARYKYPSYWCPIEVLFESMKPVDKETGRPRGYFILSYDAEHPPVSLCNGNSENRIRSSMKTMKSDDNGSKESEALKSKLDWSSIAKSFCHRIPEHMWEEKPRTLEHVVQLVLRNVPSEYPSILANQSLASFAASSPDKANEYINELLYDTTQSPLYPVVMDALYPDRENQSYTPTDCNAAFATLFVLGSPRMLYTSLPRNIQDHLEKFRKSESMTDIMRQEITRISEEVSELTKTFCTCGPAEMNRFEDSSKQRHGCCKVAY